MPRGVGDDGASEEDLLIISASKLGPLVVKISILLRIFSIFQRHEPTDICASFKIHLN